MSSHTPPNLDPRPARALAIYAAETAGTPLAAASWHDLTDTIQQAYLARVDAEETAALPDDLRGIVERTNDARAAYWRDYGWTMDGVHYTRQGAAYHDCPVSHHFGRGGYFTIPMVALHELPIPWQARFIALIEQAERLHGLTTPDDYVVSRKSARGRFRADPWAGKHTTVARAMEADQAYASAHG